MLSEGEEAEKMKGDTIEALGRLEEVFAATSRGLGFFGGERIGYLDMCLGCFVPWIEVTSRMGGVDLIDENRTPNLFRWSRRFNSDPAVEEFVPDAENLMAFAKRFAAKFKGVKL
ncbi:hypothetical protein M569_14778 [Genlisea aurea]|uniref:Glutathione S-transferase n=1 Tax=Genlisea aurea TaxID=192259 RepID=S8DBD3_9LAMI|nr:hypothetical protein M569_14778 [Genlisea aurea]